MTNKTRYVARKAPHENGSEDGVFKSQENAEAWLTELIDNDSGVTEYKRIEQDGPWPDVLFQVVEGNGKVAGHIREMPYRGVQKRTNAKVVEPNG